MQIEPYLFFNGRCEEALGFYARALDGKITALMRFEGAPTEGSQPLPPGWDQKVMHANFEADGARFMASDGMPGTTSESAFGGFSVSVNVPQDVERARQVFDALAAGGKVTMPFDKPFWGGHFGMLTDRFGLPWMVSCDV